MENKTEYPKAHEMQLSLLTMMVRVVFEIVDQFHQLISIENVTNKNKLLFLKLWLSYMY